MTHQIDLQTVATRVAGKFWRGENARQHKERVYVHDGYLTVEAGRAKFVGRRNVGFDLARQLNEELAGGETSTPAQVAAPVVARAQKPRAARRPSFPTEPPQLGAHEISGRRQGRDDRRYSVGACIHAPKVSTSGGGPDGHYYVVLAARLSAPNEDAGHYDWTEHAWVRAATDAEAEVRAASIRRAEAPKLVAAYVDRVVTAGARVPEEEARAAIPATGVVADWSAPRGALYSVARVALLASGAVVGYHGGQYDDYRPSAWRVTAPSQALVLAVRALASGAEADLAVASDAIQMEVA